MTSYRSGIGPGPEKQTRSWSRLAVPELRRGEIVRAGISGKGPALKRQVGSSSC